MLFQQMKKLAQERKKIEDYAQKASKEMIDHYLTEYSHLVSVMERHELVEHLKGCYYRILLDLKLPNDINNGLSRLVYDISFDNALSAAEKIKG